MPQIAALPNNRQNLIATGEDALSDATSCFAGSRDDRIAPLREARKVITRRMNKYAHVHNRLRGYTAEQREEEWQEQALESDEERVLIILAANEWVMNARAAFDPTNKEDNDLYLASVNAYIGASLKPKFDATDFLMVLPTGNEDVRPKLMSREDIISCKRGRVDDTVDSNAPLTKRLNIPNDVSIFTNDIDGLQMEVNPTGVATTALDGFLMPSREQGAIKRSKYGPRRTSTPELGEEVPLADVAVEEIVEVTRANTHLANEVRRMEKQMQVWKDEKEREAEERLREEAARIQRQSEAKKAEEERQRKTKEDAAKSRVAQMAGFKRQNAALSAEYQHVMEAYEHMLKQKTEEERQKGATAATNDGLPENVDPDDRRPFEQVSNRRKKSPSKSPTNRASAEARAARQGLAHSPRGDVHMDSFVDLPPPRNLQQFATSDQRQFRLPAGAGVQRQDDQTAPPANDQPTARQNAPSIGCSAGCCPRQHSQQQQHQQPQQYQYYDQYGQWVQQTDEMNNMYKRQLENAATESAARLASTGRQIARDARPNAQKRFSTGTAMEYKAVIHRFELAVNHPGMDSRAKLTELQFWFSGQASRIIDCYMTLPDSDIAYATARSHLDQTFGSTVDSLTPLIDQLLAGNQIGEWDLEAHIAFSIDILQAEVMPYNIGRFTQLDTRENIFKIVNKRLHYMEKEMLLKDGCSQQQNPATWFNLKTRIQSWIRGLSTRKSTLPQAMKPARPAEAPTKTKNSAAPQFSVLATETAVAERQPTKPFAAAVAQGRKRTQSTEKCAVCGSFHTTTSCVTMARLPMEKRMLKLKELRLCVHCLKAGHEFKDCTEIPVCSVNGCGKRHNSLFHNRPTFASLKEPRKLNVNITQTTEVDPATWGATAAIAPASTNVDAVATREETNLIALEAQSEFPSLPSAENPVY